MRRSLIVFAFGYFIIDSFYYLLGSGFPFSAAQWALVALLVVMAVLMGYQIKLMVKEEKEKKEKAEAEKQGETKTEDPAVPEEYMEREEETTLEPEEPAESDSSKYDN